MFIVILSDNLTSQEYTTLLQPVNKNNCAKGRQYKNSFLRHAKIFSLTNRKMSNSLLSDNMKAITRVSVTQQIVDAIKEDIANGHFSAGQKLPAELSLCRMMNVSRSSVREALYQLQAEGYVELRPGKGAFVHSASPNDVSESIRQWFISTAPTLEDYMEVRAAINPLAAELACERASQDEISQLSAVHEQFIQANTNGDIPRLVSLDEQFHAQIFKMSHNALLKKISDLMAKELQQYRVMSISAKENSDNTVQEHKAVLDAISAHNKEDASRSMLHHLEKARLGIITVVQGTKQENT